MDRTWQRKREDESEEERGVISLPLHQLLSRAWLYPLQEREEWAALAKALVRRVRGILFRDSREGECVRGLWSGLN